MNYENVTYEITRHIIQDIYNLMNLSINSIVVRLINNKSVEIMTETDIKKSIRIFFRECYDKVNLGMDKFNETLSHNKVEALKFQVHTTQSSNLKKDT